MSKLYNIFKLAKSKIKPRTKPDKSKVDLARSELNILKAKEKAVTKMADDVKANPDLFKQSKAFCLRMLGMKKKLTSKKTARDPNSRINKALRKWDC